MKLLSRLASIVRWIADRKTFEHDLDTELRAYLDMAAADKMSNGAAPSEAHRMAAVDLGGIEQVKERVRTSRHGSLLDDVWRDIRFALRNMGRNRTFSLVAVLTLALGIGATTAVFSIVDAVLLEPLPYPGADRLVRILEHVPAEQTARGLPELRAQVNKDELAAWRTRIKGLSHIAMYASQPQTLMTRTGAVRVSVVQVSPVLFSMLGVRPRLGRTFVSNDERPDADLVVLSDSSWRRYFGATLDIVGKPLVLDDRVYQVVGVMPSGFEFPTPNIEFWTVSAMLPAENGRSTFVNVLARLSDDVGLEAARLEVNALARESRRGLGEVAQSGGAQFELRRMQDHIVSPIRPALQVLSVSAGLILLMVCANTANLLITRGMSRWREMAIRHALGAGSGRIVRQLLVESFVLSTMGGTIGLAIAYGTVAGAKRLARLDAPELFQLADRARFGSSAIVPRLDEVTIDTSVLLFAMAVSFIAALMFGLAPALQVARSVSTPIRPTLSSGLSGPAVRRSARGVFACSQIVVATVLLIAAGLLVRSFANLLTVDTGYDSRGVVTFQLAVPRDYPLARKSELAHDLVSRLRSMPQVQAVGFTNLPPLAGGILAFGIFVPPGRTPSEMLRDPGQPQARAVTSDYLRALAVRLVSGRWLDNGDTRGQPQVLLVNRALVRRYFDGRNPVGTQVRLAPSPNPWEIVGVVDDVREGKLDEDPVPHFFVSPSQALVAMPHLPDDILEGAALGFLSFAVRANQAPAFVTSEARAALRGLDPAVAIEGETTLDRLMSNSVSRQRFLMMLLSGFAFVAAMVGAIGIYGVLASSVAQRTREIGIRVALGASRAEVLRLVLRQGVGLTAGGLLVGAFAALLFTRYLAGVLFGVTTADPVTYCAVVVGFGAVATLASYVPARRAANLDPLVAIRHD